MHFDIHILDNLSIYVHAGIHRFFHTKDMNMKMIMSMGTIRFFYFYFMIPVSPTSREHLREQLQQSIASPDVMCRRGFWASHSV